MASKVLKARVTVDEFQTSIMNKNELEDHVRRNLFAAMTSNIMDEMTIEKDANPNIGITTYTGTLHVGASTVTGYNGVSKSPEETELRVVEFTKNGKITKVELQQYTQYGWFRVPRIQIEEK